MKNKGFYIFMTLALALCVIGACVTAPKIEESTDSSAPSNAQSEIEKPASKPAESSKEEISVPPEESSAPEESIPEESTTPPPFPDNDYTKVTDKNIGESELDAYFDDSVFVGNSIMMHYGNYVKSKRNQAKAFMGDSKYFASASFSCYNNMQPVSDESVHPVFRGKKMKIEDAVHEMGVKRVYFSGMALNEIGLFGPEDSAKNLFKVIEEIKKKSPDVDIVILANTYMVSDFNNYKKLNNKNISIYNNLLLEGANENGWDFVDISTPLVAQGCLANAFCSDNAPGGSGCHLTRDANAVWTAVFRNYASHKLSGDYENPESMPLYEK